VRYLDTSIAEVEQTAAWWMQQVASEGPCEFRCQSGYFTLEGSGPLLSSLEDWAERGSLVRLLLGSNRAATLASHISYLACRLGLPRTHIALGIVSFEGSVFHPKVYHFVRQDGSEAAYVGSANFTGPGVSGLNVEAGLICDTRDGDDPALLQTIRNSIDTWFEDRKPGLSLINSPDDIARLLDEGYLSLRATPAVPEAGLPEQAEEGPAGPVRPRRAALVPLPSFVAESDKPPAQAVGRIGPEIGALVPGIVDTAARRRFLRHTEASFHYPQGTHLGHILAILWRFDTGRQGTPFDDEYIRLSGALGTGRIAGFRRQIKYKLLAAMELGLVADMRYVDDSAAYSPQLTDRARALWRLVSPYIDTRALEMGGPKEQSTTLPQPPSYYNKLLREACAASQPVSDLYSDTMLRVPAVRQMLDFLGQFPEDRVAKNDIYEGFFDFGPVIDLCNEVGIEPQTEESARHRCPFLLNVLESLGRIEQGVSHVIRL
jgi:hypothetical protein